MGSSGEAGPSHVVAIGGGGGGGTARIKSALEALDRRAGDVQSGRTFREDLHGDDLVHGDRHVAELLVAEDDEAVSHRRDRALVEVRRLPVRTEVDDGEDAGTAAA